MPDLRETLMKYTNEYLIELLFHLMDKLSEKERIEFISKYISAEIALEATGNNDSSSFLRNVSSFCNDCLNGDYYIEPRYDNYYYDEDSYDNTYESEWAEKFTEYLKLGTMYFRSKRYDISYQAFDNLLSCLHEAEFDGEMLGTDDPTSYIDVDWDEVFEQYFASMKNEISDKEHLTNKAIDTWLKFGDNRTKVILKYLDDITLIEKSIRKNIKDSDEWNIQHQLYELLKAFYIDLGVDFNELDIASSMKIYTPNFLNDVAQAYISLEMWSETIKVSKEALQKVEETSVVTALNTKLVNSYEKLNMYREAFDVSVKMFYSDSTNTFSNDSYRLYKRARFFAEKLGNIKTFVDSMVNYVLSHKAYNSLSILLEIYSFEGHTEMLIDAALKSNGYSRHDYLKYTSKSLIYRALSSEKASLQDLKEYVESIESGEISGIVDMIRFPEDLDKKEYLLSRAIEILKIMVQFHIDAASRSRYQRAAYYCAVIKDISTYMDKKLEFNEYYNKILQDNNRRPALKDEFRKKIG